MAAAEIIGVSDRTMRRWRERLEEHGYVGLADRRKAKPSPKRIPVATMDEMPRLYREKYYDLNIRHSHQKLRDEHDIQIPAGALHFRMEVHLESLSRRCPFA